MTSTISIVGITVLASFGGFLTHSWLTGTIVFAVLATAAATAGDIKLPKFISKS